MYFDEYSQLPEWGAQEETWVFAYWIPMHILGPLLKGRKAISILFFSSELAVSQREGRKV